jgi:hypothetical protein
MDEKDFENRRSEKVFTGTTASFCGGGRESQRRKAYPGILPAESNHTIFFSAILLVDHFVY